MKIKTMNEVRELLSEQLDKVRNKTITPTVANAFSNTVGKLLSTYKLEMEVMRLVGRQPSAEFFRLLGSGAVMNTKKSKEA